MAKIILSNIPSGYATAAAHNADNTAIEAAIENTLSRDGTSPNQMLADLDMNGYAILNQKATSGNENFIWMGTWTTGTTYAVNNLVYAPEGSNLGNTLICVTANIAGATLDGDAAKWAVFAQRGAPGVSGGDVVGPASATADSLARFNGTTGLLLKDGAVIGTDVQAYNANLAALTAFTTDTDGTLAANSDVKLATQKATKTYSDTKDIATQVTPGTSGNVLTSNGTAWTSATPVNPVIAWGTFNGATTGTHAATSGSSNIASITRNSIGNYTINFSPALNNANYAFSGTVDGNYYAPVLQIVSRSTTACNFTVFAEGLGFVDRITTFIICGS